MFKKNLNRFGRILRLSIACLLLILAIWQRSWIIFLFSVFTFFEAFMSWCIVYQLLGKNSCPIETDQNKS